MSSHIKKCETAGAFDVHVVSHDWRSVAVLDLTIPFVFVLLGLLANWLHKSCRPLFACLSSFRVCLPWLVKRSERASQRKILRYSCMPASTRRRTPTGVNSNHLSTRSTRSNAPKKTFEQVPHTVSTSSTFFIQRRSTTTFPVCCSTSNRNGKK